MSVYQSPFTLRTLGALSDDTDWAGAHSVTGLAAACRTVQRRTKPLQSVIVVVEPLNSGAMVARASGTFSLEGIGVYSASEGAAISTSDVITASRVLLLNLYQEPIEVPIPSPDYYTIRLLTFASNPAGANQARIRIVREICA